MEFDFISNKSIFPLDLVIQSIAVVVMVKIAIFASNSVKNSKLRDKGVKIPPHVRTFIPYLGSALEMGSGIEKFIRHHYEAFSNQPIFSATILGEKAVFIADPEYLTYIFKPTIQKYLDTESLQKQFTSNVLTMDQQQIDETFSPTRLKTFFSHYNHFLFKDEQLERALSLVQQYFSNLAPTLANEPTTNEWKRHELYSMVFSAVFKATVGPFLSDYLIDDETISNFKAFEPGIIKFFNNVPDFLMRKESKARSYLIEQLMSTKFWESASPLMKARSRVGISHEALTKGNLGLLFASVANSTPAVFWTLLHLIEDVDAWKSCQAQVDKVKNKCCGRSFSLKDLDELTLIDSAFKEALRLYQGSFTTRVVVKDFVMETNSGNYLIQRGSKLMSWWGMMNSDPYIHENPSKYQFDRFSQSQKVYKYRSGKSLTHPPLVVFGGGAHLCPGRKFISYENKFLLATLMTNFDMKICKGESRPQIDFAAQGIGISVPDRDVKVEIKWREKIKP